MNEDVLQLELKPVGGAAREARRAVRSWMTAANVPASLLEDVLLVVSELVTNAAVHARTTTRVTVRWDGRSALVEVYDADEHPPVLSMKPLTVGGWGLHLVDRISRVWGSEASADGKRVWAEVASDR